MVKDAPSFDELYPQLKELANGCPIMGYSKFDRSVLKRPPLPPQREIDLMPFSRQGDDETSLLYRAVTASYDIASDDHRLREAPLSFEKLRGDYPLRREFDSFRVIAPAQTAEILKELRFEVQ